MSGSVGVIADLAGRYSQFWERLMYLRKPVNTAVECRYGSDRAVNRNSLVRASLERGSEWMLFLDDDQAFGPDLLLDLLAAEQPVVGALYVQRVAPFLPIAFSEKDETGYWPLNLHNHGPNELVKVRAVGTGGMLIRSEVFRELEEPWFIHTTEQSEDMYFCDRLAEKDIPAYVHTGVQMGHIAPAIVWPAWEGGRWAAGLGFSESTSILVEMDYSVLEEQSE